MVPLPRQRGSLSESSLAEGNDLPPESACLLKVRSLSVCYQAAGSPPVEAVRGVDLEIHRGESVGILGESGSGKSSLVLSLLDLLPATGRVLGGSVTFEGDDLLGLAERELDRIRGDRISIVFQQPGLALNPVLRIGSQVAEVLRAHLEVSAGAARERVLEVLERVQLDDPEAVSHAYPHQLSGGQLQRVVIAQALICRPALLIADEPTASLDSETQAALVTLLRALVSELGMALILVSHDPDLLVGLADRLLVMYAGRIVEAAPAAELLSAPFHPYPRELLRCRPNSRREGPLPVIRGAPPGLAPPPVGCAFEARCPDRQDRCSAEEPPSESPGPGRHVLCWYPTRAVS